MLRRKFIIKSYRSFIRLIIIVLRSSFDSIGVIKLLVVIEFYFIVCFIILYNVKTLAAKNKYFSINSNLINCNNWEQIQLIMFKNINRCTAFS